MAGEGDAERLVVLLEARIRDFEKNMVKASGTATKTFNSMRRDSATATQRMEADMIRSTNRINQALAASSTRIGGYSKAMIASFTGAFAGAAVMRGAQQLIDANTRVTNSLKVAGLEGDALKVVYDALYASAQKNAAPIESLATLYGRVALVQDELGVSTQDLLKFTDNVSLALRVAGTDAQTASGALLQLSQAMGAGVVRAEEFNSILEGAQPIAMAAAAGLEDAGGSVGKLRALVIDGKVSSEAFFAAFQAGSSVLAEKVAGAELTTSQAMIRLQNVLQDAAGKFDDATGASEGFARTVDGVADAVENLSNSKILAWLGRLNNMLESSSFLQLEGSLNEIERILGLLDSAAGAVEASFDGASSSVEQALAWAFQFDQVSDAPLELQANIKALAATVVDGTTDAAELRAELARLGAAPVNMAIQIADIMALAEAARIARGEINALNSGPAADGVALQRDEQSMLRTSPAPVKTVSLNDYDAPTKPGKGSGGRSGAGGGKKDGFPEALKQQQQRIDELTRETAAQSQLNPLVDDYGYAIEKLRVQMDLENEAARAGLSLNPERQAAINQLAEGYATASAEAARLQEQQDLTKQSMDDWMGMSKDFAQGFVSDLAQGKSAAEALGNAFSNLADQLLQMAADQAIKALFSNLLGAAFGGMGGGMVGTSSITGSSGGFFPGFASGTANTGGRRGEPMGMVHGQEAVIPLPDGGKVPVQLAAPAMQAPASQALDANIRVSIDENGNLQAFVDRRANKAADDRVTNYRRFEIHGDIETHNGDPMARG